MEKHLVNLLYPNLNPIYSLTFSMELKCFCVINDCLEFCISIRHYFFNYFQKTPHYSSKCDLYLFMVFPLSSNNRNSLTQSSFSFWFVSYTDYIFFWTKNWYFCNWGTANRRPSAVEQCYNIYLEFMIDPWWVSSSWLAYGWICIYNIWIIMINE